MKAEHAIEDAAVLHVGAEQAQALGRGLAPADLAAPAKRPRGRGGEQIMLEI